MTEDLHVDYFIEVQELRAKLAETERERNGAVQLFHQKTFALLQSEVACDQLRAELAAAKERERAADVIDVRSEEKA